MTKDPYTVLGISKNADDQEIKRAYRRLARQYHPDVNPGNLHAEEKFKEITGAYNFLSDKEVKDRYDRGEIDADGRPKGFSGMEDNGFGGFDGFTSRSYKRTTMEDDFDFFSGKGKGGSFGGWSDFFGAFKGGRNNKTQRTDGANVTYNLSVPFVDAALGATKEISLANGKKIKVKIPAGTDNNVTLRLKGEGMTGMGGGKNGDALITIKIPPHPFFERISGSNDVAVRLLISLKEAVLGAKVPVPTLDGTVMVKIPAGTSNTTLRLKGKGIATASTTGDLLVRISVVLPTGYDAELEKFVKNWKGADYLVRH